MRLLKSAAIAAFACALLALPADAGPVGTWFGVAASVAPAGSTQTYSVQSIAAADPRNINLTVVYQCLGRSNCTLTSVAVPFGPNMYLVPPPVASPAPRPVYVLVTSGTSCQASYGSAALMGVWTDGRGSDIGECLIPPTLRAPPGGGGPPRPVTLPHLNLPHIPPYVQRPAPIGPGPAPGPIPPH
ncbi:MAG: hypothetical protein JSS00_00925 [Proteobacteria bacterium]|nr:hypothetical protein [Pseudomonadota bacterium]